MCINYKLDTHTRSKTACPEVDILFHLNVYKMSRQKRLLLVTTIRTEQA